MEGFRSIIFVLVNGLVAFLDFSVGVFVTMLVYQSFGDQAPFWALLLGGLLALVPDFDLLPTLFQGKHAEFDHRQTIFHRPVVMIPLVSFAAAYLGGDVWFTIALAAITWHFIHDTDFTGQRAHGVAWLWPLSQRFWSIYGSYTIAEPISHELFIKRYWAKPSRHAVLEITIGLALLAAVAWSYWPEPLFVVIIVGSLVFCLQMLWGVARLQDLAE